MQIRNLFFILMLLLASLGAHAIKLDNLAVLTPSCDKYSETWPALYQLLNKYWPTLDQPRYLISNTKTYPDPRIHHVLIPNEKSWSDNMIQALDQIPEDYVMIIEDDYMITAPVNEERLQTLYNQMRTEGAAYLALVNVSNDSKTPHPTVPGLGYLPPEADYRSSLQICIWKKSILKSLLRSGENPWRFELYGIERTRKLKEPFMCVTNNFPIQYFGAIGKGKWAQFSVDFLKAQNIVMHYTLPIETKWERFKNAKLGWISANITYPLKKFLGIKWYMT
jgi:hypothetical protein